MIRWNRNEIPIGGGVPAELVPLKTPQATDRISAPCLILGYNLFAILNAVKNQSPALFAAKFKAILVDLPFWNDPSVVVTSPPSTLDSCPEDFTNLPETAASSIWFGGSVDYYFDALNELFQELNDWLSPTGFIVVKSSGRFRHYVKGLLDNIIGFEKFVNEVALQAPFLMAIKPAAEDDRVLQEAFVPLFVYGKAEDERIHPQYKAKSRPAGWHTMFSAGQGGSKIFNINGETYVIDPPVGCHWKFKQGTIDRMIAEERIKLNSKDQPMYKTGESPYILDNNWLDVPACEPTSSGWELCPKIHERVFGTFSSPGDSVLHVFSGYGAGLRVAVEMQREYVGIDPRRECLDAAAAYCEENDIPFDEYVAKEEQ
ncbi:MAG TPA: DNA methyltransferase [Candidatus Lokiarchaeia archaeon]|nr:DNA methyltransferase [Candidatus Lokiarchaeia archaeon]